MSVAISILSADRNGISNGKSAAESDGSVLPLKGKPKGRRHTRKSRKAIFVQVGQRIRCAHTTKPPPQAPRDASARAVHAGGPRWSFDPDEAFWETASFVEDLSGVGTRGGSEEPKGCLGFFRVPCIFSLPVEFRFGLQSLSGLGCHFSNKRFHFVWPHHSEKSLRDPPLHHPEGIP